jgi:hypothetical protein
LLFVFCYLSFVICLLLFVFCYLSFVICLLLFDFLLMKKPPDIRFNVQNDFCLSFWCEKFCSSIRTLTQDHCKLSSFYEFIQKKMRIQEYMPLTRTESILKSLKVQLEERTP